MRSISALDVRARFGQVIDEAAAGERIVIERAGHPVAAIVPLADLELLDPEVIRGRRRAGLAAIVRAAGGRNPGRRVSAASLIRAERARGHDS